eukprot:12779877-Ditylum_brightwellii.AAC.1
MARQKLNKVWRRNKLVVSNCPERTKAIYQTGSTAVLVTSLACHRLLLEKIHAGCNNGGHCKKRNCNSRSTAPFYEDFKSFLEIWLNKNKEIILGIDINKAAVPAAEIHQLAHQLDLIDVHHHMHGATLAPPTYKQ